MGRFIEGLQPELNEQIINKPFEFIATDFDDDDHLSGFTVGALVHDEETLLKAMSICQDCDVLIASESESARCSGIGQCGEDANVVLEDLYGYQDFGRKAECLKLY